MNRRKIGKISIGAGVFCAFVFALLVISNANLLSMHIDDNDGLVLDGVLAPYQEHKRSWHEITLHYLGDADPGTGASGVLAVHVYPHDADIIATYDNNITQGDSYAYTDINNSHAGSNVPYGASGAHDIVATVRWNQTHAYNESMGDPAWTLSWVNAFANCSDLSVTAVEMVEVNITSIVGNDYIYVHYVLQDSNGGNGTGFTINRGQNIASFSMNFNAYY